MIVIRTCPILQSMSTGDLMFISICPYIKTAVGCKHGLQCSQNKHGNKRRNLVTIVQSQLEIPDDACRTGRGPLYRCTSVLPRIYCGGCGVLELFHRPWPIDHSIFAPVVHTKQLQCKVRCHCVASMQRIC